MTEECRRQVTHILILTEAPFTRRDYDRFGVELLRKNFQVAILDCTPWLEPEFWTKYSAIAYHCPGYKEVADFESFVDALEGGANAIAIDFLGGGAKSRKARIELKNRQIPRAVILHGLLPRPDYTRSEGLRRLLHSTTPRSALRKLARKGRQLLYRDPPADLVMLTGSASLQEARVQRTVNRVWAHTFDYDIYLSNGHQELELGERYAVFLDEDMAFHLDYDHSGIEPPTTLGRYYPVMNRFFERFERANGMRVIVAAHPRSHYEMHPDVWSGRTVIRNKTAQLVRGADCVLAHSSTSVSFAVLWRKPILFLSSNDLANSYLGPHIALRSNLLQQPLVNVDECPDVVPDQDGLFAVDEDVYSRYVAEFIKFPGSPDLPAWQIFSEFVTRSLH
ncbi:MAG: hypothetical protein M3Z54_12140 [Gemmatimonadota bacterium]|nr:hypothetical protein [Gemmatimonadota bacterium]